MSDKITFTEDTYYFNARLKGQLARMKNYPLTIVEAPSGFGKTTAAREFLCENHPQNTNLYWYTCLGESFEKSWYSICDMLSNVDSPTASALKNIDLNTLDTLIDVASLCRKFECKTDTFIIIDNFHMIENEISSMIFQAFGMNSFSKLHIIILTQQLELNLQQFLHNSKIHFIEATYFIFDKESIASYFKTSGIQLNEADLVSIHQNAAGWVAAVRLHLMSFEENGEYQQTNGIWELIEYTLWHKLNQEEKTEFLRCVL